MVRRFYVEIGSSDGGECNSRVLREEGWKGVLFDDRFEDASIGERELWVWIIRVCSKLTYN